MNGKHHAQDKSLIESLADRLHQHTEDMRARSGVMTEADRAVLARARLRGWKPVSERRPPAKVA